MSSPLIRRARRARKVNGKRAREPALHGRNSAVMSLSVAISVFAHESNGHHGEMSSLRTNGLPFLSTEVLSIIFTFLSYDTSDGREQGLYPAWVRASHTCRRWRNIILNMRALWANNIYCLGASGIKTARERAGNLPLTIEFDGFRGGMQYVKSFSMALLLLSQAKTLRGTSAFGSSIYQPSGDTVEAEIVRALSMEPLPKLRELDIEVTYVSCQAWCSTWPSLGHLNLTRVRLWNLFVRLPTSVTSLSFSCPLPTSKHLATFTDVLRGLPALYDLEIVYDRDDDVKRWVFCYGSIASRQEIPRLQVRHLTFTCTKQSTSFEWAMFVAQIFSAPVLETLCLKGNPRVPHIVSSEPPARPTDILEAFPSAHVLSLVDHTDDEIIRALEGLRPRDCYAPRVDMLIIDWTEVGPAVKDMVTRMGTTEDFFERWAACRELTLRMSDRLTGFPDTEHSTFELRMRDNVYKVDRHPCGAFYDIQIHGSS
ncbi:unnamed protein product [Peniophora sp. CBMAI 1063]|nr:unnamed protein product [Peniophora sp. CBMAI 1063]